MIDTSEIEWSSLGKVPVYDPETDEHLMDQYIFIAVAGDYGQRFALAPELVEGEGNAVPLAELLMRRLIRNIGLEHLKQNEQ